MRAESLFSIESWDESTYRDFGEGAMMNRAGVVERHRGSLEGEANSDYLMHYLDPTRSTFVGLMAFEGKIGERAGRVIFEGRGVFADGIVRCDWRIIPGSGTVELGGISGLAHMVAEHKKPEEWRFSLEYNLG